MSQPHVTLLDPLEATVYGPDQKVLRVGLALPRSGVIGLTGPSALESAILAAGEINVVKDSESRPVEFVVLDSGAPPPVVAREIDGLLQAGAVEAFIGLHTSQTLEHVEKILDKRVPYVFASGFEDARHTPGIYYPGETPTEFAPGLSRIISERSVRNWAILGTDYVWPRAARVIHAATIAAAGARVVLDALLPLDGVRKGAQPLIDAALASGAQGLLINMPGRDLVTMLRAVRSRGLDKRLIRVSGCLEENTLYAIGGDRTGNLYASMHSFDSLKTAARQELNDRYHSAYGQAAPALNAWAEHCYDSVHLLAEYDRRGLLSTAFTDRWDGPAVSESLHPHYRQHLAVAEGLSFNVL